METSKERILRIINVIYTIEPHQKFYMVSSKDKKHLCECVEDAEYHSVGFNDLNDSFMLDGKQVYRGFERKTLDEFRNALVSEFFNLDWWKDIYVIEQ